MRSILNQTIYLLMALKAVLSFWTSPSLSFSSRRRSNHQPIEILASTHKVSGGPSSSPAPATVDVDRDNTFRELAFRVSSSFQPREFRPATPLLANKHVQTISGAFLRNDDSCRYVVTGDPTKEQPNVFNSALRLLVLAATKAPGESNQKQKVWDKRERIDTPEGDFFHVDSKFVNHGNGNDPSTKGLVIIVHGLQSNSNATLVTDMATAYGNKGFDVACINFRSCSGEPNDGLKAYHLGFTDDLKQYLSILNDDNNDYSKPASIFVTGKSLGANVVLNTLGELGMSAYTEFNIHGAAVNCVPFDNERNKYFLLQGFSKLVYNGNLMASLKETAMSQLERFVDTEDAKKVDFEMLSKATTIPEFDEAFIAPLFGFKSCSDYYNRTSCLNFLDKIRVPTFIMNSKNDPFMDPDFFPWEYGCDSKIGRQNQSPIRMVRTESGGHLGYMFHSREDLECEDGDEQVSFMPSELARFINHVYERRAYLDNGKPCGSRL